MAKQPVVITPIPSDVVQVTPVVIPVTNESVVVDPLTAPSVVIASGTAVGPQGTSGPAGPAGADGADGATGATGPAGVISASSPVLYNSGTQNVSLDQTLLSIGPSQVTGTAAVLTGATFTGTISAPTVSGTTASFTATGTFNQVIATNVNATNFYATNFGTPGTPANAASIRTINATTVNATTVNATSMTVSATATSTTDVANKAYVDSVAQGLNIHPAVQYASSAAITGTYVDGANDQSSSATVQGKGVGATFSFTTAPSTVFDLSGATLSQNDRVLLKNQANARQNGVYAVTSTTGAATTILTRTTDSDNHIAGQMFPGDFIFVDNGLNLANTGWALSDAGTALSPLKGIVLNVNSSPAGDLVVYTQFSGAGTYTGGTGINVSAGVISINSTVTTTTGSQTLTNKTINGADNTLSSIAPTSITGTAITKLDTGMVLPLGTPALGALVSNAVTMTTGTWVTDGIAQLNKVLGKLVPTAPTAFPSATALTITGTTQYRIAVVQGSQATNGNSGITVTAGSTVNTLRAATFTTNTIGPYGPGDSGVLSVIRNTATTATRTLVTGSDNGTYTVGSNSLVVSGSADYPPATPGFWEVVSAQATGASVVSGWNTVQLTHSQAGNTNTAAWYYDSSAPGTPVVAQTAFTAPVSPAVIYSSNVPHYTSANSFTLGATATRLSGDTYPTSDTFVTGVSGGAFLAPASVTYTGASITQPLTQNLYVSSGSATIPTTAGIRTGFGVSNVGPSISVVNSYATGSLTFSPGANVLYKTGATSTAAIMDETNLYYTGLTGVTANTRIILTSASATPTFTGSESAWTPTTTVNTNDAVLAGNVISHNQVDYSTNYLPVGPNYSSGRTGDQFFTFKFQVPSLSSFKISITTAGSIAGIANMWVALPGVITVTQGSTNGWLDMGTAYFGSGLPGAVTNGCSSGGVVPFNTTLSSPQLNGTYTCTFGTGNTSNAGNISNEFYVRIRLVAGQTITALSLGA